MNFIRLNYEIDHKSCNLARDTSKDASDYRLKMLFSKASNKLEEVEAQRCVMQEKAKSERYQQEIDANKLESVEWFDYSGFPRKYTD